MQRFHSIFLINLVLVEILAWDCMRNPPKPIKLEGMTTWISISLFAAFYILTTYADFFMHRGGDVCLLLTGAALLWPRWSR